MYNSIHSFESKPEEEQPIKWVPDEEVDNCMKCNIAFGWTVRKVCN